MELGTGLTTPISTTVRIAPLYFIIQFTSYPMTPSYSQTRGLLLLLVLSAFHSALVVSRVGITESSRTSSGRRPVLLLAGDSLTEQGTFTNVQGWAALLQARYTLSADVVTRGIPGFNTKWFLKYAMPIIENEISFQAYTTPSFITIWLGTNDAALVNGSDPETHVPIKNYKENLIQIVTAFQASAPNAGILLITPPHIDDGARAKYASEVNHTTTGVVDRSNAMTANYSLAALDAAKTLGVPVLDLNAHFNAMPELTRNALLIDGIHFNADGHKIVDKLIRSKVKSEFPSFDKALQSLQFPQASDLALEDPYM